MHTQSDSIAALAAALAKAQAAIPPAPKNAENPHYRSHYADLASVWSACRAPLAAQGIAVIQSPSRLGDGTVCVSTTLAHSSGEWVSSICSARATKDDAQGVGSVITYLRRYALAAMVGVTSCEDDDANAAVAPTARSAPAVEQRNSRPISVVQDAPPSGTGGTITSVTSRGGVGKNGKPYTRWAVEWMSDDGSPRKGSTLSASVGDAAETAHRQGLAVSIETRQTQYGHDVLSIVPAIDEATVAKMEATDEIPF